MSDARHVVLMLCTRGRPVVRRACISAISGLDLPQDVCFRIVVCDNNAPSEVDAIEGELAATGHPFRVVREARRGYCFARNAAVEAAIDGDGDILIFIDDDHAVEPDLIARYLDVFDGSGADVVHGSYVGSSRRYRDGQAARKVATYNVAFRRRLVAPPAAGGFGLRFDERLNLVGREDLEFFRTAAACGANLVYSEHARTRLITLDGCGTRAAEVPPAMAYAEGRNAVYVERLLRGRGAAWMLFLRSYLGKGISGYVASLFGWPGAHRGLAVVRGAFDGLFGTGVERPEAKAGRIVELE